MKSLRYIKLFNLFSVPVYMHWSLTLVVVFGVLASISSPSFFVGAISFWGIMLIHELGHAWFAFRYGLNVYRIDLHIFHGCTTVEVAKTEFERSMVYWGGVAAQFILIVPSIAILHIFGRSLDWVLNTPLLFFGYISLIIAIFNLAPSKGLDGYYCWKAIPLHLKYGLKSNRESISRKSKKNPLKRVK